MSDDEADPELLELLRQHLGISKPTENEVSRNTGVLASAEFIYNNAIDVNLDMLGTKGAAAAIYQSMQQRGYSRDAWSQVELHPKASEGFEEVGIINFVFTMDLLNFSFWSKLGPDERFQVEYRGRRWTGYSSLLACLRRALDEGLPVTTPKFWRSKQCSDAVLRGVFRSATDEEMPMLEERISILRQAGEVLRDKFGPPDDEAVEEAEIEPTSQAMPLTISVDATTGDETDNGAHPIVGVARPDGVAGEQVEDTTSTVSSTRLDSSSEAQEFSGGTVQEAVPSVLSDAAPDMDAVAEASAPPTPRFEVQGPDHSVVCLVEGAGRSAGRLVNLLAKHFDCFRDEARFEGRTVRFLKRAQIFAADLWAAFGGQGPGEFDDIDHLTMFADYRVPQMLHSLGVLVYSPRLEGRIRRGEEVDSGHGWEVQLRGCSIWAVEMIRRTVLQERPRADVNAVLLDFLLYDLAKERELAASSSSTSSSAGQLLHHRTRSIWY